VLLLGSPDLPYGAGPGRPASPCMPHRTDDLEPSPLSAPCACFVRGRWAQGDRGTRRQQHVARRWSLGRVARQPGGRGPARSRWRAQVGWSPRTHRTGWALVRAAAAWAGLEPAAPRLRSRVVSDPGLVDEVLPGQPVSCGAAPGRRGRAGEGI